MHSKKFYLKCPRCRNRRLHLAKKEQIEIDVCLKCGGLWLDQGELEQIVRQYDPQLLLKSNFLNTFAEQNENSSRICPKCRTAMVAYMIKEPFKLDMDVCETCNGIWLDHGELEQAQIIQEVPDAIKSIETQLSIDHWLLQFFVGLPLEFNVKPRRFPIVTVSLVLVNIIIFLKEIITRRLTGEIGFFERLVNTLGLIPDSIGSFAWILNLFSYQFLHLDLYHLFGNMYFLYIIGDNLEDALGSLRFLLFYLVCGVGGGLFESLITSTSPIPIIGASGAIAGVIAAYSVIFRRAYLTFMFFFWQWKIPSYVYFSIWIAFNLLGMLGKDEGIAWFVHIGGFLTGLIISLIIYDWILKQNPLIKHLNTAL